MDQGQNQSGSWTQTNSMQRSTHSGDATCIPFGQACCMSLLHTPHSVLEGKLRFRERPIQKELSLIVIGVRVSDNIAEQPKSSNCAQRSVARGFLALISLLLVSSWYSRYLAVSPEPQIVIASGEARHSNKTERGNETSALRDCTSVMPYCLTALLPEYITHPSDLGILLPNKIS